MKKMTELSSGSLVRFLQEMHVDGMVNALQDDHKPVLLQIRSIIPVLKEGDHLWPNQGFFLRVSDLSHAIFVSLPQEQDDMVLCDKLRIGQNLYVEKLEAAYPVPLLKGIRPVPGRHPCLGNPKDLIPMKNLERFLGVSKLNSVSEDLDDDVIKNPMEDPQSLTNLKAKTKANSTDTIKEKQREKSLYTSASGLSSNEASSDEGMIKTEGLISMNEENNNGIKEEKQQSEKPDSLNNSREVVTKTIKASDDKVKKKQSGKSKSFSVSRSGSLIDSIGRRTSSIYRSRKSTDAESTASNYRIKRNDAESYYRGMRKQKPRYGCRDSDTESTISAASPSSMFKRRSWSEKEATRILEIVDNPVVKHEVKPEGSIAGVPVPLAHSLTNDSSDDNSGPITEISISSIATKSSGNHTKRSIITSDKTGESDTDLGETFSSMNEQTGINISWDLLPSSLVKLGQEVLRQRDIAMFTAIEALLDTSAAERLLKCLSIYSDIVSAKSEDHHQYLERFFVLENNLEQTKLIFQSGTGDHRSTLHSVSEETRLALDRKQNATTWIKAALESDLNPVSDHIKTSNIPILTTNAAKIPTKISYGNIPRPPLILRKQRSNTELHAAINPEMENQQGGIRGRCSPASAELANCLDNESRTWFLSYVEDYLDWVSNKNCSSEPDSQVREIMHKIKKVSDWVDLICKDKSTLQDSEIDSCGRVRNKIYEILMKHVERTTMNATC